MPIPKEGWAWSLVDGEMRSGMGKGMGEEIRGGRRECFRLPLDCYPYFSRWVAVDLFLNSVNPTFLACIYSLW